MPEMKGVTVRIPAELHAEVKAYIESHGMTMGEFITQAVDHELHPKIELKEDQSMERIRTLAFQVPESLFQRVKAYLERNHMSQKQFVIGLIEAELEQDEAQYQAAHPEEQEDEEEIHDQTQNETEEPQDQLAPQEAQDGPESQLEEQPTDQENAAPVDDFEEVSQEDGGAEEPEEEAQETEETSQDSEESEELDQIEDFEDSGMEEISEDSLEDGEFQEGEETWEDELSEESQDEEETWGESSSEVPEDEEDEQAYQPSMAW